MSSRTGRVLVTGGAGFIGLNLVREIAQNGFEPLIYDCEADGQRIKEVAGNIEHVQGDIRDLNRLIRIARSVDGIIHLAAVSRVIWGFQDPRKCIDVNIVGTVNVLEAARQASSKPWVIYGSSREVYGEPDFLPVKESAPKKVANVYGLTKIASEKLCQEYSKDYGLGVGILRFSNVYGGANDHLDRVTPKFIIRSLEGQKITIQGGGQIFDFTHISDTIDGIVRMMEVLDSSDESYLDDFHILTGQGTTLQQLVSIIDKNTGNSSEVVYGPARSYDVEKFYGDPTKARKHLGFASKIDIEEGIRKYVPVLREHLESDHNQEPGGLQ